MPCRTPSSPSGLTNPLGMTETHVQTPETGPLAPRGYQPWGIRPKNWVMDAYQPVGGYVSTASDMGKYLQAVLDGTAFRMDACAPCGAHRPATSALSGPGRC